MAILESLLMEHDEEKHEGRCLYTLDRGEFGM